MDLKTVFLSSTGRDLREYREAVYEAIHQMDGYHCYRMEDFGARDCRSEAFCRQKVRDCDVCVLIAGQLYGSCPEGGEKSFTEIEYETALECQKPRLVFVAPEDFPVPGNLVEPTESQQKQKAFRVRIDKDRQRQEFGSPWELAAAVLAAIHNWEKETPTVTEAPQAAEKSVPHEKPSYPEAGIPEVAPVERSAAMEQQLHSVKLLSSNLSSGALDFVQRDPAELTSFDVVRLLLTVTTLFSRRWAGHGLTVQEANALYAYRELLEIAGWEGELLWRTLLRDAYGVVPGWYWFREADTSELQAQLSRAALDDPEESVRKHAIEMLCKARLLEPARCGTEAFEAFLQDDSGQVRKEVLEFLAEVGADESLGMIDLATRDPDPQVCQAAQRAKWYVSARTAPETAFRALLGLEHSSAVVLRAIQMEIHRVPEQLILKAVSHKDSHLRRMAVDELTRRGRFQKETALALVNDESPLVKEACYKRLVELGESFTPEQIRKSLAKPGEQEEKEMPRSFYYAERRIRVQPDAVIYELFRRYTYDELVGLVHWPSIDGPIAYRVLSEHHFDRMSDHLRSDLDDEFESLGKQWESRVREGLVEAARARLGNKFEDAALREKIVSAFGNVAVMKEEIVEYLRGQFISAALAGLVMHGNREDVRFGRRFLEETSSRYYGAVEAEALKLLEKFADQSDVPRLVTKAKQSRSDIREDAARLALRLSPGIDGVGREFLDGDDAVLFDLAANSLLE